MSGDASLPGFGDAWQIDVGVCLLAPSGSVCNGHGQPNLDTVTCSCDGGWSGKYCTDGANASNSAPPASSASATAAGVSIGLLVAVGAGLYVYSTYFGGGPVLKSAYDLAVSLVTGGGSGSGARFLSSSSATSVSFSSSSSGGSSSPLKGYGSL